MKKGNWEKKKWANFLLLVFNARVELKKKQRRSSSTAAVAQQFQNA